MFSLLRQLYHRVFFRPYIQNWLIPKPTHLWFAGKPTEPDTFVEAKLTPLADIEQILGIKWTEVPLINRFQWIETPDFAQKIVDISQNELLSHLTEMRENCVIRWLDNDIGWVVTLRPGKTLSKGFLTGYTGIVTSMALDKLSYAIREFFFSLFKTKRYEIGINAKKSGNFGRFLPFLLEPEHLANFTLAAGMTDKIATANLEFKFGCINGANVPFIYAENVITAPLDRELLLGLNYSLPYLYIMQLENKHFRLINKDQLTQLDPQLYPQKMVEVRLEGLTYAFSISRFRVMIANAFPESVLTTGGCDETTGKKYRITILNKNIYQAFQDANEANIITVKPTITQL